MTRKGRKKMSYDFSSFSQRLCSNVFHCILLYTNVLKTCFGSNCNRPNIWLDIEEIARIIQKYKKLQMYTFVHNCLLLSTINNNADKQFLGRGIRGFATNIGDKNVGGYFASNRMFVFTDKNRNRITKGGN